jgi:hypothetical protein
MKSPFPGMDPYLEDHWGDVHGGLIFAIRAAFQPRLAYGLRARGEVDLLPEEHGEPTRYRGDVAVLEVDSTGSAGAAGAAAIATPLVVKVEHEMRPHRWVQIIDTRARNRVVTAIEVQ